MWLAGLLYGACIWIAYPLPFLHCLLFGALISPTDPIAVIAILNKTGVSKSLELKIEGESLFNDGLGVVVFMGVLLWIEAADGSGKAIAWEVMELFGTEALGGIIYGLVLGFLGWSLIKSIQENEHLAILLSLVIAMGGYAFASIIHVSGPLAMVVTGLVIGNKINSPNFSKRCRESLTSIWEVLDDTLKCNALCINWLGDPLTSFSRYLLNLGFISNSDRTNCPHHLCKFTIFSTTTSGASPL